MRTPIIAGNWKMNNTIAQGKRLIEEIKSGKIKEGVEAVLCVPYTLIQGAKGYVEDTDIKIGAQNVHWVENGAFTGEVSPVMLKELEVDYVIIGHSERRQYFNETDKTVNLKVKAAIKEGITPIVCVGETLEQREEGVHIDLVKNQVIEAFEGVVEEAVANLVIAYEPIWAIGTGKTATSDQAEEMCRLIRETIESIYDVKTAQAVRIQYGGSVKPDNIVELMEKENIDGALVGGASLKAEDFLKLLNY